MNTQPNNPRKHNKPGRLALPTTVVAAGAWIFAAGALAQTGQTGQTESGQAVQQAEKERVRTTTEWDLPRRTKLAIKGYDPVAYFPEGGGKAKKGSKDFEYTHKGVTYRFVSREHREMFKKAPDRYEPAHGLWCSWAMTEGDKTEPNPKTFIVKDDRLFLFYDGFFGNTKNDWLKGDHKVLVAKADREWLRISREEKRQVKLPGEADEAASESPKQPG